MARSDHTAGRNAPGHRRARRAHESVSLVAVGMVLLGIAAWSAARARLGTASADLPSNVRGSEAALNDALLVAAGAFAAAVVIFVAPALMRQGRRPPQVGDDEPRQSNLWLRVLGGVMVIFAVVLVIMLAARNRPQQTEPLPQATAPPEEFSPRAETRSGAHGWSAVALAAAGAIAVGTAVVVWRRRGRGPALYLDDDRPLASPRQPVDFAALDPADAVRAAYAAARSELTLLGVELRPPETPYQYLDRVRESAPVVERPVTTLTRLFEVARFSHHPVTAAMKTEAIAAYNTIAHEATRGARRGGAHMSVAVVTLSAAAFVVLLTLLIGRRDDDAPPTFAAIVRAPSAPPPEEPASFKSARWLVVNAATAGGLYFRVRPILVDLTDARLRANHGMHLQHPGAPAAVGDSLWTIVRPDARPPNDRMAPGLTPSMLRVVLDRLEML